MSSLLIGDFRHRFALLLLAISSYTIPVPPLQATASPGRLIRHSTIESTSENSFRSVGDGASACRQSDEEQELNVRIRSEMKTRENDGQISARAFFT